MKKIILSLLAAVACMSVNAQVIEIYEDGGSSPIAKYTNGTDHTYKVVFKEAFVPTFVDLGLPSGTLWATCNVGSNSPEEFGYYYAWGETELQADNAYSWASYKYTSGDYNKLTKYCNDSSYGNNGFTDTKTVLDAEDDAATVNWGSEWCMPTDEQFTELIENCTCTWTTENGVYGRKVTATNGNSIFLPAVGRRCDGLLDLANSDGYYWSRTLITSDPSIARNVRINSDGVDRDINSRCYGFTVRPVRSVPVTSISLNMIETTILAGSTETLSATISPSNASNQKVTWSSSNTSVATVDATGKITGVATGTATITVTTEDGGKTASCEVTVYEIVSVFAVSLNKSATTLLLNASETLSATVAPSNATNKNVTWTSSNTSVATVNSNGKVSGTGIGNAIITATTQDGSKTASCIVTVTHLLQGQFSVSASKKVQFTRGNLYWNGSAYDIEPSSYKSSGWRYDYNDEGCYYIPSHVCHFYWKTPGDVAAGKYPYAENPANSTQTATDVFFCGESNKLTVAGITGLYALSSAEWTYLIQTRPNASNLCKYGVCVAGYQEKCLIIAPDDYDFTNNPLRSYYNATDWAAVEAAGLVCLAPFGSRFGNSNSDGDAYEIGYYWTSTPSGEDRAYYLKFDSNEVNPACNSASSSSRYFGCRYYGFTIRLVKTVE